MESDFSTIASAIVNECFPDQRKFWTANQRAIREKIVNGQSVSGQGDEGDFHFLAEAQTLLSVAGQAASLVAALLAIYSYLQERRSVGRSEQLQALLKEAGIVGDKAGKIAEIVSTWKEKTRT